MNFIELADIKSKPDNYYKYDRIPEETPLVIDNGSYKCRVGWNNCDKPLLIFRNLMAKVRKDRKKHPEEACSVPIYQVGNDIENIEAIRAQIKTQFERNIVTQFRTQEEIFNYTFEHLGLTSEKNVQHPVFLTEAVGTPKFCRENMNELLFECYGVPSITYSIDFLSSYKYNLKMENSDALIISIGHNTTHVAPVLDGQIQLSRTRRLNVGGQHIALYLHRLMQMKYPVHINALTLTRMESLLNQYGYISKNFSEELKNWSNIQYYEKYVKKIQLPFTIPINTGLLSLEQKQEKRKEVVKRLLEINTRRANERIMQTETLLQELLQIRNQFNCNSCEQFKILLQEKNISSVEELDTTISNIQARIDQFRKQSKSERKNLQTRRNSSNTFLTPPQNVDLKDWVVEIYNKRDDILKRKQDRKQHRQDLSKRHTPAAQERMRMISKLARYEKGKDEFGLNDNDWNVYKVINGEDSESEQENEQLIQYEAILRHHVPSFEEKHTISSQRKTAEHYQLHLGLEVVRCPEILFQPSMIGNSERGLGELIHYVLSLFSSEEQQRLCHNIFLTGGCAQFQGLKDRLSAELLSSRPFGSIHNVTMASCPSLDAWLGACNVSNSKTFTNESTTKAKYLETG